MRSRLNLPDRESAVGPRRPPRSPRGDTAGQSPFQASGSLAFRYLMRTGMAASRSERRASSRTGHQSYKKISRGRHMETQPPIVKLSRTISPIRLPHLRRYLVLVVFSFTVALAGWQWRELRTQARSFWKSPATRQFRATNSTATHASVSSIEVLTPRSREPSELAYERAQRAIEETPASDQSREGVAAVASNKAQVQPVSASTRARDSSEAEGEKYLHGDGVPANCVRARQDLLAAAENSSAKAQTAVGTMYATGHCATQDLPLAYRWFAHAQRQNPRNRIIEKDMRVLWDQMSPEERTLATR